MAKNEKKEKKANGFDIQVVNIGDSKRFTKWNAPRQDDEENGKFGNEMGIVGTIYIPKDMDVPDTLTIKFVK